MKKGYGLNMPAADGKNQPVKKGTDTGDTLAMKGERKKKKVVSEGFGAGGIV